MVKFMLHKIKEQYRDYKNTVIQIKKKETDKNTIYNKK